MSDIAETIESRTQALAGRLAFINAGTAGNAALLIFSNTRPASPADAAGADPLVLISLQNPAGVVTPGAMSLLQIEPGLILAGGAPTWARVVNRDGAPAFDMDVGLAGDEGSTATCRLSTLGLFPGGLVSLVSAVLG